MGKAQSKRSVDITTETKKGSEDEVIEKMEKIEDLDKKEVNGDATISEKNDQEKKDNEEVENDKDKTTEKDVNLKASGDAEECQNIVDTPKDDEASATVEEISPLADENAKKSKKEKVKKKWSFRSISFGKKDKQKPAKSEDAAEDASAATNGADTDEKTITEPEDTQKDKTPTNENEEKAIESHENGNATQQELNGVELNEDAKSNDTTANTTNNTIITETCVTVQKEAATVSNESSEKTENTAVTNDTNISENATVDDASNDEKMNATDQEPLKTDVINASVETHLEKTNPLGSAVTNMSSASTNGEVVDEIHQNGDHGESEQEVIEKSKAQIEVNSNTDKVSAATLDYISTTFINPSNVQIHNQDLNTSSEKPDKIFLINNDESVQNLNDIEIHSRTVEQTSVSEISNVVEDVKNKAQIETTVSDFTPQNIDSEKLFEEKIGVDIPPPPLPISPPPSQVSVFAFTNNDESVEDSIQTKNFEPANNNLNDEEEKKETSSSLSESPNHNSNQEIDMIHSEEFGEKISSHNQVIPQIHDVAIIKNIDVQYEKNKETEVPSVCKDSNKDTEVPSASSGLLEESLIKESETSVEYAAAVINEITETAAKIIKQQLKCNEEQETDQESLQNNEERTEYEPTNANIFVECDSKEHNDDDYVGGQEFEKEVANSSEEYRFDPEHTNNITTECSLNFIASDSIQEGQDETISLIKSENVDEEHLEPIKEFATAKDIKDNVTMAEITQDLSVTCE